VALFTAASAVTTMALACATPFPALAALAAVYLRRGAGAALVLLAWGVSQVVGFGLHHYPHTPSTIGLALTLGVAALVAEAAAQTVAKGRNEAVRLALGYGAGFVAFKLTVLAGTLFFGGAAAAMAPMLVGRQFVRDGLILIGLALFYHLLRSAGVPAPRGRRTRTA